MDESQEENKLHFLDYWRVIRSRKEIILAIMLLVVLTGTAVTFTLPKTYMSNARIKINQDSLDVDVFERQMVQGYNPFFMQTEFEIIQSRPIVYEVIKALNLEYKWGKRLNEDGSPLDRSTAYRMLKASLKIAQYRDTSLIDIQVYREDPQEAMQIANNMAFAYRDQRLSVKRHEMKRAIDSLENQLQKQQEKVGLAEEELQRIRKELGLAMIGSGQRAVRVDAMRLQQLEADRIAARVAMLVHKAQMDELEKLDGEELMNASSYIVNDQVLASVRRELIDSEVSLSLLQESYGANHPDVKRMQAGVSALRGKLQDALDGLKTGLRSNYRVAKAKFDALEAELTSARESDIATEGDKILPFERAERNLMVQREILVALRARVAQEGIELEVPRTPVEIVDSAEVPQHPVSPNVLLNILLSLFLGLGAGVGLAYFIEYLDTSVKTVDDVERYLGQPVIGVIPQKVLPLIEEGPDSPHAEAYRVLRTNLSFTSKGANGGAFAFVSGGVGEGKSTTLFNLAYICASLGDKILIVDSDLRRPVQHTFLDMSNRFGLTNVLLRDVPIEETIKPTSVPNLHLLPSGKLPRSSLGLLDTQKMRELIKNLKARYDYVFFDAPPLVGVSDASILASEVDGVLLVVQYRKYPRVISSRAARIVDNVGGTILGVVLNNINVMKDDYYYYYHSYSSHYFQPEESSPQLDGVTKLTKAKDKA